MAFSVTGPIRAERHPEVVGHACVFSQRTSSSIPNHNHSQFFPHAASLLSYPDCNPPIVSDQIITLGLFIYAGPDGIK